MGMTLVRMTMANCNNSGKCTDTMVTIMMVLMEGDCDSVGVGHTWFLLVICLSLPPVSHPGELLPSPGTTVFTPMSHKVGARDTTRILRRTCIRLISNVVYSTFDGIGSCLSELVVVCTCHSRSRVMRALDPSFACQQYVHGACD